MQDWKQYLSLSKIKRIEMMAAHGFNVPRYLDGTGAGIWEKLRAFMKEHQLQRVSVRTYSKDEQKNFKCPHFPNVTYEEAVEKVGSALNVHPDLQVMASEGINPADALYRGNLVMTRIPPDSKFPEFIMEWLEGPGTVRDLESSPSVRHFQGRLFAMTDPSLRRVMELVFASGAEEVVFEWSIYCRPLGALNSDIIFWEFRKF